MVLLVDRLGGKLVLKAKECHGPEDGVGRGGYVAGLGPQWQGGSYKRGSANLREASKINYVVAETTFPFLSVLLPP